MIERENNMSNDTLRKFAIKEGIYTRSKTDSIRSMFDNGYIIANSGDDHWRSYNKEASAMLSLQHSKAMKKNNPSKNPDTKLKITSSLCKRLKNEPTFHESLMIDFFNKGNIVFEHQFNTGIYIADFRIGPVLIEIDGRGHASRKASDRIRDKAICDLGFYVVRVNQDCIYNKRSPSPSLKPYKLMSAVHSIIEDCNVSGIGNISSLLIPDGGKYRVVIRQPDGLPEIIK